MPSQGARIEETLHKKVNKVGDVYLIPWNLISRDPTQPRKRSGFDLDSLRSLADNIHMNDQLQPGIVYRTPRSRTPFALLIGERRHRSVEILCQTGRARPFEAKIVDKPETRVKQLLMQGSENRDRVELSVVEMYSMVAELHREGCPNSAIADALGLSEAGVGVYVELTALDPEVITLLDEPTPKDKRLAKNIARSLAKLNSHSLQRRLAHHISEMGLKGGRATMFIRSAIAEEQGDTGASRRNPARDWRLIASVLKTTQFSANVVLDIPASRFKEVVKSRRDADRDEMLKMFREGRDLFEQLLEATERISGASE